MRTCHCSWTPEEPYSQAQNDCTMLPSAVSTTSASSTWSCRGSIAAAYTLAVYASQCWLPRHHARLASGWWLVPLPGGIDVRLLAGLPGPIRRVSVTILLHHASPLPRLAWRNETCTSGGQSCDHWRTAGPGLVARAPRLAALTAEPSDLLTLAMLPDAAAAFRGLRDRPLLKEAVSRPDEHADVLRPAQRRQLRSGEARRAAEEELGRAERAGVRLVAFGEPDYPALLTRIYDPPPVLWVRGQPIDPGSSRGVAMVGSRAASAVGRELARRMAADLALASARRHLGLRPGHRYRRPSRRAGSFWAHRGGASAAASTGSTRPRTKPSSGGCWSAGRSSRSSLWARRLWLGTSLSAIVSSRAGATASSSSRPPSAVEP